MRYLKRYSADSSVVSVSDNGGVIFLYSKLNKRIIFLADRFGIFEWRKKHFQVRYSLLSFKY